MMPISNQDGYDDSHFDLVYEDIIKPAIEAAGMEPLRADETKNTNLIQLDILKNVIQTPIAICDMSAKNPNVFYELGLRQAFDLPTVLLKDDKTHAPFDINGLRYCTYNHTMKHREVKEAILKLTEMLKDTYEKKDRKDEVNSLIRLLELSSAAKEPTNSMSGKEREEALFHLKLDTIVNNISEMNSRMLKIEDLNTQFVSGIERTNTLKKPVPPPPPQLGAQSGLLAARDRLRAQKAHNIDDDF